MEASTDEVAVRVEDGLARVTINRSAVRNALRRRLGTTLPLHGVPLGDHRTVVRKLVDVGYTDVWAGETTDLDAVTPLAAAAAWAPELGISTSVIPAFTRGPALVAMTAAALAELAPGRVALGIGASSAMAVTAWNAVPYLRPVDRVRDLVRFLRDAFTGSPITRCYETFEIARFQLGRPVTAPPSLLVGALRPRMLAVAADEADGAIVTAVSADDLTAFRRHLAPGSRLVAWVSVCPLADLDEVRSAVGPALTAYLCVPAYRELHRWLGRADRLTSVWDAWGAGQRRRAVEVLPNSVIDELVIHGSLGACRMGIERYFDAGADDVVVSLSPGVPDPMMALEALART